MLVEAEYSEYVRTLDAIITLITLHGPIKMHTRLFIRLPLKPSLRAYRNEYQNFPIGYKKWHPRICFTISKSSSLYGLLWYRMCDDLCWLRPSYVHPISLAKGKTVKQTFSVQIKNTSKTCTLKMVSVCRKLSTLATNAVATISPIKQIKTHGDKIG